MGENHGHDGYARVGQGGGHGQQGRPAPAGRGQAGDGKRHGTHREAGGGHHGARRPAVAVRDTGPGQGDERADSRDDRAARTPCGPAQAAARPQPHRGHAEDERRRRQHLHDRQRARTQREGVDGKCAQFRADAEQPPRPPHQQQEQGRPARCLPGRRGGLVLLKRGTGAIKNGGG
jgi:hypothetical protein